jgi:hypothetical protein
MEKYDRKNMKIVKVIIALIVWVVYIYLFNIFISPSYIVSEKSILPQDIKILLMNVNDWLLGIIATFSVLTVICGGAGYIIYRLTDNKEKEQMFKKMLKFGLIVLFFATLTYSLTVVVIGDPIY